MPLSPDEGEKSCRRPWFLGVHLLLRLERVLLALQSPARAIVRAVYQNSGLGWVVKELLIRTSPARSLAV